MCGIAGMLRMGRDAEAITTDELNTLLLANQHRGGDATGLALQKWDGTIVVHKHHEIAHQFCVSRDYKAFLEEHLDAEVCAVICHTRFATQGSPYDNANNHPLTSGKAAIVHNGHINNDEEVFKNLKATRGAETDSDAIRAIVDREGMTQKALRVLNQLRGNCASAILHPETPGKVMLLRSGSPLVLAKMRGKLIWASEKKAIHLASRCWQEHWKLWFQRNTGDVLFNPMKVDSAWIIGQEGLEFHAEFKSQYGQYYAPKYDVHGNFAERHARFMAQGASKEGVVEEGAAVDPSPETPGTALVGTKSVIVQCRNPNCLKPDGTRMFVTILPHQLAMPRYMLWCNKCNWSVGHPPKELTN